MMRILIITNELLNTCGVSKHILYFLREMKNQNEFEFSILCGGGDSVDNYQDVCKEVIVYEKIKHTNRTFINYAVSVFNLIRLIQINKYNIIHSHNHYTANIAQAAAKFTRVKTVQSVHGINDSVGRLKHYPADYYISVNEHVYEYLIKHQEKIYKNVRLIRYGIIPVNSNKQVNQKLQIITAGRIILDKGFDTFIEAVSKLDDSTKSKADFIIAGKGEYEQNLKKLAHELGVNINFIGEIRDLRMKLLNTDIFIIPSKMGEGFPLTIIESALTKNLLISSNFLGYNSILENNINALIFHKGDSLELAKKIEYAIENYHQLKGIIERLYEKVSIEFSVDKTFNQLLAFYFDILK